MGEKINMSRLLPKIRQLPVLPAAITEILRVVNDPGSNGPDIEWAVSRDQAVSAKVLKIVNSAAYGVPGKVETICGAVVLLGMRQVRDIAASMAAVKEPGPVTEDEVTNIGWAATFSTPIVYRTITKSVFLKTIVQILT